MFNQSAESGVVQSLRDIAEMDSVKTVDGALRILVHGL
jgi:hypothetical protein